jgi:hypothetical protein
MWFNTVNGLKPSIELAHAMDGLDRRARSLGVFMTIFQLTVGAA